jgi:hypothetical protein
LLSQNTLLASHHMCASLFLLNAYQMPQQSSCPLASLISGLFLSDTLEKCHKLFHKTS